MRILYYSPHPNLNLHSPSGYGTHMREMIGAFENLGHEVLPVIQGGTCDDESIPEETKSQPLKQIIKRITPTVLWESLKDVGLVRHDRRCERVLTATIQGFQPDIIYERANYLQISGVKAAQQNNVPHILEINAPFVEERSALSSSRTFLQARARRVEEEQLQGATKVAVVSSVLKKHLAETHGIAEGKFIITPNAINLDSINPDADKVQEIRDAHNLNHCMVIGFVGSMFKWHGVDLLLHAFHEVVKSHSDLKLLIVGDGDILPGLKQLSECLNLSDKVIFTGKMPHHQVFGFIQAMDVTILAKSNWYGSPVKLFEYAAMKKAVVAPDNGPVRDVMVNQEDGLLIQPDVGALTASIRFLIENPTKREEMAASFHRKVMTQHTWGQMAGRVLDSVQWM